VNSSRAALWCGTLLLFPSVGAAQPASSDLHGVWRNPKNTVHVEIQPCGAAACGVVVWATPKAKEDVRRSSGRILIGLTLLHDLTPSGAKQWRGRVFVPDLNVSLSGFAELLDSGALRAKGCLVRAALCKSQTWTRVAAPEVSAGLPP
jgi:uncharacterized protein (DUF2147 family)